MSIYATLAILKVQRPSKVGEEPFEFEEAWFQGVPAHIDYTGEAWAFLPPPVDVNGRMRCVFCILADTEKGTERCGQEFHDWLFILSDEEYFETPFYQMMERLEKVIEERFPSGMIVV